MASRLGAAARLAGVVLAAVAPAYLPGAPAHDGKVECATPRSAQETLFLHEQRLLQEPGLAEPGEPALPPVTQVGEIALVEATPEVLAPPNPFDLTGRRVSIRDGPDGFSVATASFGPDAAVEDIGLPIRLEDDDYAIIELPFAFPYYGSQFDTAFVHSDGNLTFVYPEHSSTPRSYSRAAGGPPRVAPLFYDLDPSQGGTVRVESRADRVLVLWDSVPFWVDSGVGTPQTFQLALAPDGSIEFRYGRIDLPGGVVGTFPGDPTSDARPVDWSAAAATQVAGEPILAEIFADDPSLDEFGIVHSFYRAHEDAYDTLIVFNDLDFEASQFSLAHAYTVRNRVEGIGEFLSDYGLFFGSPRRLSSFVNMGSVSDYPGAPTAPIPGLPHSSLLTILAHEVGHRFLAYPAWINPESGESSHSILGRQRAHWSFFFDTSASVLEGNAIRDNGAGERPRFETVAASQTYSPLDQYLMGLRPAHEVPPTFLVEDPTGPLRLGTAGRTPEVGVRFDGIRKEVRIEDIVAAEGPRKPDSSLSQRHFRHAFALVVEDAENPDPATVRKLRQLRANWLAFIGAQLDGRATVATELVRMLHLSTWPAGGVLVEAPGTGRVTIAEPLPADLAVSLSVEEAIASPEALVTIPAGEVQAEFEIRGLESGVTTLVARATEPGYDRAVARLSVKCGPEGLELESYYGDELRLVAASDLTYEIDFRIRDENLVPYSGVGVEFRMAGSEEPALATALTGPEGFASLEWMPPPGSGERLLRASVTGAPEIAAETRLLVAPHQPAFAASAAVNAASGAAPPAGGGFAPGSLVTIHGAALAADAAEADTLLVFENPSLPYELGGTRVHVGGVAVPLVSVSPAGVTFQMPFEVEGGAVAVRVATSYGGRSPEGSLPLSPHQPGLFADRVEAGVDAEDGEPVPQEPPLPTAGGVLLVYGTGFGAVSPPGRTGLAGFAEPPQQVVAATRAWVDGEEVKVRSSELAPFEAGVYLVEIDLPADLEAGMHAVKVAVGGVESNEVGFSSE